MDLRYGANPDRLLSVRRFACMEGRAKNLELYRVTNAAGLDFEVLVDRCLGIGNLYVDGGLVSYLSETGPVHPAYYEPEGHGWLRSFGGGFLATRGLDQVGEPCHGAGLHGRIDNIPAQQLCSRVTELDHVLHGEISGVMRQSCHQGEFLELRRTIRFRHDQRRIWLEDEIINRGGAPCPFQLLYHVNFGPPFLRPGTQISLPAGKSEGWDEAAHRRLANCRAMPDIGATVQDYLWLHATEPTSSGLSTVHVDNGALRVTLEYETAHLPILGQWVRAENGCFVLALEPTNSHLRGRDWEREQGSLPCLAPGQHHTIRLTFAFSAGRSKV